MLNSINKKTNLTILTKDKIIIQTDDNILKKF